MHHYLLGTVHPNSKIFKWFYNKNAAHKWIPNLFRMKPFQSSAQWCHSKFWKNHVWEFTNYVYFPETLIVSTLKTQFVNEREKFKDRRIETGSEETFPKLFYCNNKHNFGRCVISWHKRITHSYELNLTFWQTIKLNEISMYISRD